MAKRLSAYERGRRERERAAERARKHRERESEKERASRLRERERAANRREREHERAANRRERERAAERKDRDREAGEWEREKKARAKEQERADRQWRAARAEKAFDTWRDQLLGIHRIEGTPATWGEALVADQKERPHEVARPFCPSSWTGDVAPPKAVVHSEEPAPPESPPFTRVAFEPEDLDFTSTVLTALGISIVLGALATWGAGGAWVASSLGSGLAFYGPLLAISVATFCLTAFACFNLIRWIYFKTVGARWTRRQLAEAEAHGEEQAALEEAWNLAARTRTEHWEERHASWTAACAAAEAGRTERADAVKADNARRQAAWKTSEALRQDWWDTAWELDEARHHSADRERIGVLINVEAGDSAAIRERLLVGLPFSLPTSAPGSLECEGFDGYEVAIDVTSSPEALIAVLLPTGDPVPPHALEVNARGTGVRKKALGARERHRLRDGFVASLTLGHAVHAFRLAPSLEQVVVETSRRGVDPATGLDRREVVLHVVIPRTALAGVQLPRVDAIAFMEQVDHRWLKSSSRSKKLLLAGLDISSLSPARGPRGDVASSALPGAWAEPLTLPFTKRDPPFPPGDQSGYPVSGAAPGITQVFVDPLPDGAWAHGRLPEHVLLDDHLGSRSEFLHGDMNIISTSDLAQAVASAPYGQVILLGPGEWQVPLELDRPVHIIGAGAEHTILTTEDVTTVESRAPGVVLEHMTLRCIDVDPTNGWAAAYEGWPGSEVVFRDVLIEGSTEALVRLARAGAHIVMQRTRLRGIGEDCRMTGVEIGPCNYGAFADVEITGCNDGLVADQAELETRDVRITDNRGRGLVLEGCCSLAWAGRLEVARNAGGDRVQDPSTLEEEDEDAAAWDIDDEGE